MIEQHAPLKLLKRHGQRISRIGRAIAHLFHEIDQCIGVPSAMRDFQHLLIRRKRIDRIPRLRRQRWQRRMILTSRVPVFAVGKIPLAETVCSDCDTLCDSSRQSCHNHNPASIAAASSTFDGRCESINSGDNARKIG
jgi:hypothetical protein